MRLFFSLWLFMPLTFGAELVITAHESTSIDVNGMDSGDNRVRAYYDTNLQQLDGFMKFDLSGLPDGITITSAVLTTYHEAQFGSPSNDPEVRIYRVTDDSWNRTGTTEHPGLNEVLTSIQTGFPTTEQAPVTWDLDTHAISWPQDLNDNTLSLAMRNEKLAYSFVYFYGSDATPAPPTLTLIYSLNCPTWAEFYARCEHWTQTMDVRDLIYNVAYLPNWKLLFNAEFQGLKGTVDLGEPIAEDEVLSFTIRHWGNGCVGTDVITLKDNGAGTLVPGTPVIGSGYIVDQPYAFTPSGPGDVSLASSLNLDPGGNLFNANVHFYVKALYQLSVSMADGTTGSPSSTDYYVEQTSVPYGYSLENCYETLGVLLDSTTVSDTGTVLMDADHALETTANFITYDVVVTSETGGSTDRDGTNTVDCGGSLTITPTADTGYTFCSWTGDATGSNSPLTLSNITGDLEVTAVFAEISTQTDAILGTLHAVCAGTYWQGSPTDEPGWSSNELLFEHTLSHNLLVMEIEVTRQMWSDLLAVQATLPVDPSHTTYSPTLAHPVQQNTWYESVLFANLVSIQRGFTPCYYKDAAYTDVVDSTDYTSGAFYCDFTANGFRLPSEGEWEYLTRAGTASAFSVAEPGYTADTMFSCTAGELAQLETVALYCANYSGTTGVSGSKLANPWGLKDVHGNVWEWCWDWYGTYPVGTATDYTGPSSASDRVIRGACWFYYSAVYCRSAFRESATPGNRNSGFGFRLVRTYP